MSWSAKQYSLFERERNRPASDLVGAIDSKVRKAIDVGCGRGNSTEILLGRYPDADIRGMDSSAEMVEAARKRLPEVSFEEADLAHWADPGPYDVILANAVLQWVPDHERVLPELMRKVAPGGSLAVQMPDNLDEPAHALMREVAGLGSWRAKLAGAAGARAVRRSAEWYFHQLRPHASRVDVWRTTYNHQLAGIPALVEWFKGTGSAPSSLR